SYSKWRNKTSTQRPTFARTESRAEAKSLYDTSATRRSVAQIGIIITPRRYGHNKHGYSRKEKMRPFFRRLPWDVQWCSLGHHKLIGYKGFGSPMDKQINQMCYR
ncbi:hypothetical protein SFRURICE_006320, partial [Spodoptera frugiperda]